MVAAWSNESTERESEEEVIRNHCLIAKKTLREKKTKNFEEVTLEHLLTFTKEYLAQALLNYVGCEQEYLSKIKSLRRTIKLLKRRK